MKIVFIVIDTLRADHLKCYGYSENTSPNIDKIASEGVLFERAYASDVPTQPSYTSMFTGQRGVKTGIVSHSLTEDLGYELPYLSGILGANGHLTAAVSTLYMMRRWFAEGFHYYMNPYAGRPRALLQQVDADDINAMAIPWIKANANKDFFIFIHYWDPHTRYEPPEKYRGMFYKGEDPTDPRNSSLRDLKRSVLWPFYKRLLDSMKAANNFERDISDIEFVRAQYDGEIRYVDDKIGELIQTLTDLGVIDETLLILTSDHGESLGEHNEYFDHCTVYEPIVHVPLIIRYPKEFRKGDRIKELVQLIDIPYTILKLANIAIPETFEGKDLRSIANKEIEGYGEVYSNQGLWTAKRTIITKDGWKLIETIDPGFWECPPLELYNLRKDPKETENLALEEEEVVKELMLKMTMWLKKELGIRPDPLRLIASRGLPAKEWVKSAADIFLKTEKGTYEEIRMRMGF
jgi:arylsulfatase A-like enzyme